MNMKRINKFLYIIFFTMFLISTKGCGQTGDLYLPEEANSLFQKYEYRS